MVAMIRATRGGPELGRGTRGRSVCDLDPEAEDQGEDENG